MKLDFGAELTLQLRRAIKAELRSEIGDQRCGGVFCLLDA